MPTVKDLCPPKVRFHLVLSNSAIRFTSDCIKELSEYQLSCLREVYHVASMSHGELLAISVVDGSVTNNESWMVFKRIFKSITNQLPDEEFSLIIDGIETGSLFSILENGITTSIE